MPQNTHVELTADPWEQFDVTAWEPVAIQNLNFNWLWNYYMGQFLQSKITEILKMDLTTAYPFDCF